MSDQTDAVRAWARHIQIAKVPYDTARKANAAIAALEAMVSGHKERIDHEVAARDRFRAKVAALEAENAGLRSHQACTKRAEAAEAEVERLRAQRCETCATCSQWNHGHGDDGDVVNYCRQLDHAIPRDFYCNRWTAREEGGDE